MRMMIIIAMNTCREGIRNQVLYAMVFFALAMIGVSSVLSRLTMGQEYRVLENFGLTTLSIIGVVITIFMGVTLVQREIDRRTIFALLSTPLKRYQFIVGKFFGLVAIIMLVVGSMGLLFVALLILVDRSVVVYIWLPIAMTIMELTVIAAATVLFSATTSPVLAAMFSIGFFVMGRLTGSIGELSQLVESRLARMIANRLLTYLLPHLELFDFRAAAIYRQAVSTEQWLFALCYGMTYSLVLVIVASMIFERRDIT